MNKDNRDQFENNSISLEDLIKERMEEDPIFKKAYEEERIRIQNERNKK